MTYLFPGRYVDRRGTWTEFDIEEWSDTEYEWTQDRWNGLLDFARRPEETVARGRGDCEDYALVAASWAVVNGREGVGLAFCWKPPHPWPTHAIAFDESRVYSSGRVTEQSVDEWLADSEYSFALRRSVN